MLFVLIAALGAAQPLAAPPAPVAPPQMNLPHVKPRLLPGPPLVTHADYPAFALRSGQQGKVAVTLSIGADGRVTHCGVIRSSGVAILDQTACRLLTMRARFDPARDASGVEVPSAVSTTVGFLLP